MAEKKARAKKAPAAKPARPKLLARGKDVAIALQRAFGIEGGYTRLLLDATVGRPAVLITERPVTEDEMRAVLGEAFAPGKHAPAGGEK